MFKTGRTFSPIKKWCIFIKNVTLILLTYIYIYFALVSSLSLEGQSCRRGLTHALLNAFWVWQRRVRSIHRRRRKLCCVLLFLLFNFFLPAWQNANFSWFVTLKNYRLLYVRFFFVLVWGRIQMLLNSVT